MTPWMRLTLAVLLAGTALAAAADPAVTLTHVHGLSYSADGKRLMIPSHHGLAVYANGKWSKAPGPQHDFMGFSATAKHLYSSGHPAPGSGLVNPFGDIPPGDLIAANFTCRPGASLPVAGELSCTGRISYVAPPDYIEVPCSVSAFTVTPPPG